MNIFDVELPKEKQTKLQKYTNEEVKLTAKERRQLLYDAVKYNLTNGVDYEYKGYKFNTSNFAQRALYHFKNGDF